MIKKTFIFLQQIALEGYVQGAQTKIFIFINLIILT